MAVAVNGEERAEQLIKGAEYEGSTFLDLGELGLTEIPVSLLELKDQLEELVLGRRYLNQHSEYRQSPHGFGKNSISDLNPLSGFSRLRKLHLSESPITSLEPLGALKELEVLDLKNCGVYDLEGLQNLSRLKNVDLAGNKLTSIDKLAGLDQLQILRLYANKISSLDVLINCPFSLLTVLDLSTNNPSIVADLKKIAHLTSLESLYVSRLGLRDVEALKGFSNVKLLTVDGNQIEDTSAFSSFTSLVSLRAKDNLIRDMRGVRDLTRLRIISISGNKIDDLNFLEKLTNITDLDLVANSIVDITPVEALTNLSNLDLSANYIRDIQVLAKLRKLEYVTLYDNEITDLLPILQLPKLIVADLKNNKITDLSPARTIIEKSKRPIEILFARNAQPTYLPQSLRLLLTNNPIVDPPKQYLRSGTKTILSYWVQQDKLRADRRKKQVVNEARLIIVGNSYVGKSTLAYLLKNKRLPDKKIASTHGMEFTTWRPGWKIQGAELTINIIDFGGQEYYHDAHHLFFNDKAVFLLLWDPASNKNMKKETLVGKRDHWETIRHFDVEYWINAIDLYAGDPPVLLVQTFLDEVGNKFLNMEGLHDKYRRIAGAVSIGLNKPKSLELDILLLTLQGLFQSIPEQFGQSYDPSWIAIRNHIEKAEKERYEIMTIAGFRSYFLEHCSVHTGIQYSEEDVRTMCITLNHWGVILYRDDEPELRDIIIINPQNFTLRANRLLTEKLRERPTGIPRSEIPVILGIEQPKADAFIRVLQTFKMIFELPQEDDGHEPSYISPMYLGDKPSYAGLFLTQFIAYYKIKYTGYFHKGILLECFKELGSELLHAQGMYFCWQWGLVLKRGGRVVCIEFDDVHLHQVLIKTIRSDREALGRDQFLQDIFKAFDKINKDYKVDIELSCTGADFVSKVLILTTRNAGLNKFDLGGKRFDVRDFSFLLLPEETGSPTKRVFVSYSSRDRRSLDALESHLRAYKSAKIITYWNDLFVNERAGWDEQIKAEMENANILIMLLSSDYLGTDYIVKEEMPLALSYQRAAQPAKQVFWVQLRPCDYQTFPDVATYPIYPLKEGGSADSGARHLAISEYPNADREWVRLLKRFLDEE